MTIETMLDQLAEFQAQVDYLEIERKRLTDEVKVPDEVLAVQKAAKDRRKELGDNLWARINHHEQLTAALLSEVKDPPLPPEFVAAKAMADQKRKEIIEVDAKLQIEERIACQSAIEKIDADLEAQVADVYAQVDTRKQEINAEFTGKADDAKRNIDRLTTEIKAEVLKVEKTVKGQFWQAVYTKGRTTWTTDVLDGVYFGLNELAAMMKSWDSIDALLGRRKVQEIIAAMTKARKVGQPSIALRKV